MAATPVASVVRIGCRPAARTQRVRINSPVPTPGGTVGKKKIWSGVRESNPPHLLGRQRPKAARPTPLTWRALCFALRLPVSMRRIVACAGLWAGVFGWSESAGSLALVTCLPPALRRRQGQSGLDRVDSGFKLPEQSGRPRRAMAACRGARIEWFSDCSNHGGAICTPAGFRSQASCQHFTRDITTWHENNGGVSVNTLNNLPRDAWRLMRSVPRAVFLRSRQHKLAQWRRESSTLCHWNLFAIRCAPRIAGL